MVFVHVRMVKENRDHVYILSGFKLFIKVIHKYAKYIYLCRRQVIYNGSI